jgi:hypothetical protein
MLRFTIRDVLWLMVVVAMGVMLWKDRATLNQQRAAWERERASQRASLEQEWTFLKQTSRNSRWDYDNRMEHSRFLSEHIPEADRERSKQKSIELCAPQAKPLPPGYGEKPNPQ